MTDRPRISAGEVSALLAERMTALAPELLPAGRRNGAYWSCGSVAGEKGKSLYVHVTGGRAGNWTDAETGEFGDALDLVAACLTRGDTKEAYRWAFRWLGLGDLGEVAIRRAHLVQEKAARDAKEDEIEGRRWAMAKWLKAEPAIAGTPVEAYLRARGIDMSGFGRLPRVLRYAPAHYCSETQAEYPAMMAGIVNRAGELIAVHQTWLEKDANGVWGKARLELPKKVRGRMLGGAIRLRKGASGARLQDADPGEQVVIGEGIETCLSVAMLFPELRVLAAVSLPNMATIDLPPNIKRVMLLADNDTAPEARAQFQRAEDAHLSAGREVHVARSPRGKDFNDAIRLQ